MTAKLIFSTTTTMIIAADQKKSLRILHTSDWHLGQTLYEKRREEEHELFLLWLRDQLREWKVDVLIVAGDVFDSGNPPSSALSQYYQFLKDIPDSPVHHVIIIAGNHDSPGVLQAPKDLLKYFHIDVIGAGQEDVLILKNGLQEPICLMGAVPFLRERELLSYAPGESLSEREMKIREQIKLHYQKLAAKALEKKAQLQLPLPIVGTGHLYTAGSESSDSVRDIYLGNLGAVSYETFPKEFSYMALGHLHRSQKVGSHRHIRYSGSPIPLSFQEGKEAKFVLIADFWGDELQEVHSLPIPIFRPLFRFQGTFQNIVQEWQEISLPSSPSPSLLTPWAEIEFTGGLQEDGPFPWQKLQSMQKTFPYPMEILCCKQRANYLGKWPLEEELKQTRNFANLEDLSVEDVFLKRCQQMNLSTTHTQEILGTFRELMEEVLQTPNT